MDGFARRTELKKQAIIEATSEILLEKGCTHLKIEDIAKKANVSQVTIYNYFGSKKNLVRKVFKRYMNDRFNTYKQLISEEKPFPEIVRTIMLERKNYSNMLTGEELSDIYEEDSELKEFFEELYHSKTIPLLLQFIQKGKEKGYIRKEISDEAVLFYLDAMKTMIDHNMQELMNKPNIEELSDQLFDMFFYGILNDRKKVE